MSATPVPLSTGSPTSTDPPLPISTGDHATLRIIATIIPIVIIIAIVIWGMLVAAGVMHRSRRLARPPAPIYHHYEKQSEPQKEPKLWEVHTETAEVKTYLEGLNPLSVEIYSKADLTQNSKRSWSLRKKENTRSKRGWRDLVSLPHPEPKTQNAQVAVLVAMPMLNGCPPGQPLADFAIGIRQVIYTTGDKSKLSTASEGVSGGSHSVTEMPIILDLCAHGFIG